MSGDFDIAQDSVIPTGNFRVPLLAPIKHNALELSMPLPQGQGSFLPIFSLT
jgi:hypothetical protein